MSRSLLTLALLIGLGGPALGQVIPTMTQSAITCGATSGTLLPANAASKFIVVATPSTGGIWINWTGAAAVTAPPSEHVVSGAVKVWSPVVPQSAATCISDTGGSVTVTVEYR